MCASERKGAAYERNGKERAQERDSLVGTPEYYSPEQAAYIMDEDDEVSGNTLTCKSDIFTLGIIFCEYFTGEKPILPSSYKSTWSCVADGGSFSFRKALPSRIEKLIRSMLLFSPDARPTINEVFDILKKVNPRDGDTIGTTPGSRPTLRITATDNTEPHSGLRGSGLKLADKK